ncbi:hypothetical protein IP69_13115 [Bosea sp. AAP35]|uniref:hypothetical protein n=1 Tax=Bosea sp. AAP35 TaxID=1523417 RepID=UPI0006B9BF40|nr:hypothetical protein [Bosea sp. AAP35]KPF67629.1 hypothetical protein IP69_13115 [Bosea sp. AAP35]
MTTKSAVRLLIAFLVAVVITAILGSIAQTQFNLAAIAQMGGPVTGALHLRTTAQDLLGFGPVMGAIAAAAFLPAFAAAFVASRFVPAPAALVYALAGFLGIWAAFSLMGYFTPMPTLVAAVRGEIGLLTMSATGLIGGLVFSRLARSASA